MNVRRELIQKMYEMMSVESGVHDEVNEAYAKLEKVACKDIDERSVEYDEVLDAICTLEHTAFTAGANMVLGFIAGGEEV